MELNNCLSNKVGVNLKSIIYVAVQDEDKNDLKVYDSCKVVNKTSEKIDFIFTREAALDYASGFNLKIEVEFTRYAKKDVDLLKSVSDDEIEEGIEAVSASVANYVSLLIGQITSSFNRMPLMTSPYYIKNK